MRKTSRWTQMIVYIRKNARLFKNQKDWKFIVIAAVISFLVCMIVGDKMFESFEGTQSGFFAIISAAIWIGIFNSIQRICKEHETITSEYRAGLHITSYIMSHVVFDFAMCFAQALILSGICYVFIDFPKDGIIFYNSMFEYFITFFLVIWCSDILGIMVSSVSSTPNVAMTAMPFVLILQLIMSGVLFKLQGWSETVANITYSKWGIFALGSISDLNSIELRILVEHPDLANLLEREIQETYEHTSSNLLTDWAYILIIAAVCIVISIVSLKIRNRNA